MTSRLCSRLWLEHFSRTCSAITTTSARASDLIEFQEVCDNQEWSISFVHAFACIQSIVVVKLPLEQFHAWENKSFEPEARFLEALQKVEGLSVIETQTYTLEVVNLMGKIRVPKASEGCMADSIPTFA
mmetsp:Transcript_19922/g.29373  ORF Transcript_19922/g.29373 Transcript_19922/m.29373 type:complete len:129 (+) Transcript_19922:1298-1684(+)